MDHLYQQCDAVQNQPEMEGFNREQREELKSKQYSDHPKEGKWRHVYKIIFPNDSDDDIPTPCKPKINVYKCNSYSYQTGMLLAQLRPLESSHSTRTSPEGTFIPWSADGSKEP